MANPPKRRRSYVSSELKKSLVKEFRDRHGFSIPELASMLGVTTRTVRRWEDSGQGPQGRARDAFERLAAGAVGDRDLVVLACFPDPVRDQRRAEWGRSAKNGMEIAQSDLRDLLNVGVHVVTHGTGLDPNDLAFDLGEGLKRRVLATGAQAIIGPISSSEVNQALREAEALHVPLVALAATSTLLNSSSPYLFRTCFTDAEQADRLREWVQTEGYDKHSAAVVEFGGDMYSSTLTQEFARYLELPPERVITSFPEDPGFSAAAERLSALGSRDLKVVMVAGSFLEVGRFVSRLRASSDLHHLEILSGDACDSPALFLYAPADEDKIRFTTHYFALDRTNPQALKFSHGYVKKFDSWPSLAAVLAYDALLTVGTAWSQRGGRTLAEALTTIDLNGATGSIRMSNRQAKEKRVRMLRVNKGHFDLEVERTSP